MIRKKENKEKVRGWILKLKELEQVDLPRAEKKALYIRTKNIHSVQDLEEVEEEIEDLKQKEKSIKKVIRNLKREK